jgi:hypothetical protein
LIALGLFGLAWGGFTYTTREKVVDIGPIHATRDKTHNVLRDLPPVLRQMVKTQTSSNGELSHGIGT